MNHMKDDLNEIIEWEDKNSSITDTLKNIFCDRYEVSINTLELMLIEQRLFNKHKRLIKEKYL